MGRPSSDTGQHSVRESSDAEQDMDNKTNKPSGTPPNQWLDGDLFDALVVFHKKVIALLGAANLDDDKLDIAGERLKLLMAKSSDEIKRTPDLNVQRRMDSMFEEAKRLVDELSQSPKKDTAEPT
jgi:hypothetical protein